MTIAAWVIAGGVGLYAVALLIARFAGSNSVISDDLTDEQLQAIAERRIAVPGCGGELVALAGCKLTDEQLQAIADAMDADQAERDNA